MSAPVSAWFLDLNSSSVLAPDHNTTLPASLTPFQVLLSRVITPLLYGLISLLGLVGNSLVIYVILSNQKMRTVTNLLLLNLAVADLCFVIVVPPFTAYQSVMSQWPFGDVTCRAMHFLVNVTAYVTVYTLVLISVTRYLTVVHSVRTVRLRTRRNTVIMICATWLLMLALNTPIPLAYEVKVVEELLECDISDTDSGKPIFATLFVFAYLLPLVVIAGFSLAILRHIAAQRAACSMLRQQGAERARGAGGAGGAGGGAGGAGRAGGKRRKRQASRLLVLVVALFALLWLPIHVLLLVAFFFGHSAPTDLYNAVTVLAQSLAYFNSCVNPIIYNRTSKDFRDAFRAAVCCCPPRGDPGAPGGAEGARRGLPSAREVGVGGALTRAPRDAAALARLLPKGLSEDNGGAGGALKVEGGPGGQGGGEDAGNTISVHVDLRQEDPPV